MRCVLFACICRLCNQAFAFPSPSLGKYLMLETPVTEVLTRRWSKVEGRVFGVEI
jgi:hypothetical protein